MNEKELISEYNTLLKYIEELRIEHDNILNQINELDYSINSLNELKNISNEKEILFPFVNGVLVKGKITFKDKVLVNIGHNVVVEKSIDEAKELIKKRKEDLEIYLNEIKRYLEIYTQRINEIIKILKRKGD